MIESEQEGQAKRLPDEQVDDYVVAALAVLRGLTRADKLKVIRRMRKVLA